MNLDIIEYMLAVSDYGHGAAEWDKRSREIANHLCDLVRETERDAEDVALVDAKTIASLEGELYELKRELVRANENLRALEARIA